MVRSGLPWVSKNFMLIWPAAPMRASWRITFSVTKGLAHRQCLLEIPGASLANACLRRLGAPTNARHDDRPTEAEGRPELLSDSLGHIEGIGNRDLDDAVVSGCPDQKRVDSSDITTHTSYEDRADWGSWTMWKIKVRLASYAIVAAVLSACTGDGTGRPPLGTAPVYPPAAFAHRVSSSDIDVYWSCARPEPDVVRLDGVVQNSGGRDVEFVELEVNAVDARDRSMAAGRTSLKDLVLHTNQISPFTLYIRAGGTPGRLDLFYNYRLSTRAGLPRIGRSDVRQFARDVCSETQHRVPQPGR